MTTWNDEYLTMLDDCEVREERLTDWERGFVDSLRSQIERDRRPSQKQIEMEMLCNPNKARIERRPSRDADVFDQDGNLLWIFPGNYSDEQIRYSLRLANQAFSKGVMRGQQTKAAELRKALEVEVR